jgi:hypothetical protein
MLADNGQHAIRFADGSKVRSLAIGVLPSTFSLASVHPHGDGVAFPYYIQKPCSVHGPIPP